jgi:hypothetical protein
MKRKYTNHQPTGVSNYSERGEFISGFHPIITDIMRTTIPTTITVISARKSIRIACAALVSAVPVVKAPSTVAVTKTVTGCVAARLGLT